MAVVCTEAYVPTLAFPTGSVLRVSQRCRERESKGL